MTSAERKELEKLQKLDRLCSMGDRPPSMSAAKLKRLMELEEIAFLESPAAARQRVFRGSEP